MFSSSDAKLRKLNSNIFFTLLSNTCILFFWLIQWYREPKSLQSPNRFNSCIITSGLIHCCPGVWPFVVKESAQCTGGRRGTHRWVCETRSRYSGGKRVSTPLRTDISEPFHILKQHHCAATYQQEKTLNTWSKCKAITKYCL